MKEPIFELTRDKDGVFSITAKIGKDTIITDGTNFEELYSNIQDAFRLYLFDKPKFDWEYYLTKYFYQLSLSGYAFDLQAGKHYA